METKRNRKRENHYYREIDSLCDQDTLNVEYIDRLNADITYDYTNGKIRGQHYDHLKNEISYLYQDVYGKKIESLSSSKYENSEAERRLLDDLKKDIEDTYAKGKMTGHHYNLLIEKISDHKNN